MHVKKVLCVGEILWDIIGKEKFFGGAPLNVAANLSALGVRPWVLSALGRDALGEQALKKMRLADIETELVEISDELSTGTAIVHPELDGNERFELPYPVAYDGIVLSDGVKKRICEISPDGIVFGTLGAYRSETVRKTVETVLDMFPDALSLYDVNLRKTYFSRELVSSLASRSKIMKLNDGEVGILSPMLFEKNLSISDFAGGVIDTFGCDYVVVTKGENGAVMFGKGSYSAVSGTRCDVVDTVGAGDAFSAGVLAALLNGVSVDGALKMGNRCGADCVSHAGAFPVK